MNFTQGLQLLGRCIHDTHRVDRVQIDRNYNLGFSVNGTTWYEAQGSSLQRRYALDDPDIPLALWASKQAARRILVIAYRPGKRLVIRDLERDLIVKGYAKGKSVRAAKRHLLAEQLLDGVAEISVPALVSHNPTLDAIEFEYLTADPLRIMQASDSELERVGSTLANMQLANDVEENRYLRRWTIADELGVLDQWSVKVQKVALDPPESWHAAVDLLAHKAPIEGGLVLAHRDLHDGQWLSTEAALWLLDFDTLCLAHPMLDLGNFAAHIDLRFQQWANTDQKARNNKLEHLLSGYHRETFVDHRSFGWFRAASLLRLALVYKIRPRWRHLTEPLVAKAHLVLHELAELGQ